MHIGNGSGGRGNGRVHSAVDVSLDRARGQSMLPELPAIDIASCFSQHGFDLASCQDTHALILL